MKIAYFDTSALLKFYVNEVGSNWVQTLLSSSTKPIVFISNLTLVEARCAFARRLRDGTLSSATHAKLISAFIYDVTYNYQIINVISTIIESACQLADKHPLRAYDAVQLATALLLDKQLRQANKQPLNFISADNNLITIAQAEGVATENPNNY